MKFCVAVWVVVVAMASSAFALDCNGDSVYKKHLLNEITELDAGQWKISEVILLQGNRPPLVYATHLTVLSDNSSRYQVAKKHFDYSRSQSIQSAALSMAEQNPQHMERYRKLCTSDDSTDSEVLSRGVEVLSFVAHTTYGRKIYSEIMTSYKPDSSELNIDQFNLFLKHLRETLADDEGVEFLEALHNHPLTDTLSEKDLDFISQLSFQLGATMRIVAWVEYDNKIAEVASPFFVKGKMKKITERDHPHIF